MLRPYVHAADLSQLRHQSGMIRGPNRVRRPGQPIGRHIAEAIDGALEGAVVAREPPRPDVVNALIEVCDLVR